jgi:hypothetical protein
MGGVPNKQPSLTEAGDPEPIDRPTLRPSFDVEAFARESDSGLHETATPTAPPPTPRSFQRPEVPPMHWGRSRSTEPSSPDLEERPAVVDPLDVLGIGAVPVIVSPLATLHSLNLAPEARRLLACIDGAHTLGAVCEMAKMNPRDGAGVLLELVEQGIVSLR